MRSEAKSAWTYQCQKSPNPDFSRLLLVAGPAIDVFSLCVSGTTLRPLAHSRCFAKGFRHACARVGRHEGAVWSAPWGFTNVLRLGACLVALHANKHLVTSKSRERQQSAKIERTSTMINLISVPSRSLERMTERVPMNKLSPSGKREIAVMPTYCFPCTWRVSVDCRKQSKNQISSTINGIEGDSSVAGTSSQRVLGFGMVDVSATRRSEGLWHHNYMEAKLRQARASCQPTKLSPL